MTQSIHYILTPRTRTGFGLVETVVGVAIIGTVLLGLAEVGRFTFRLVDNSNLELRAVFLTEEGIEAIRTLRDTSWTTKITPLANGTSYYFTFSGGAWQLGTAKVAKVDSTFLRTVTFGAVNRDSSDNIVTSGGTLDPNARQVTVAVGWMNRGRAATTTISTYLTNLFNN